MSRGSDISAPAISQGCPFDAISADSGIDGIPAGSATICAESSAFVRNAAQVGDALVLMRALADDSVALGFFDPQYRELVAHLRYGNEGVSRQRERARLPAMSPSYIDEAITEFARVLRPSGYLMRWLDKYVLCEGRHLCVPPDVLKVVDLISTDNDRIGMGYRTRCRGDHLLVMQKPPIKARATWTDRSIPDRWIEKVDRRIHPHVKPISLIERLIGAVTQPGDLVVDPAAGSFVVMHAAMQLGRTFIGCDLVAKGVGP
jgi:site-specific DNA-methyltransferase (adenine-specific)